MFSYYSQFLKGPALEYSRLILGLHPPNERRRYKVTLPLIAWAQI